MIIKGDPEGFPFFRFAAYNFVNHKSMTTSKNNVYLQPNYVQTIQKIINMKRFLLLIAALIVVSAVIAQNTDCDITLPFTDSFENDSVLSPCWTVILADATDSLPQYGITGEDASDSAHSLMLLSIYSSNYDLYLITPELPVSGTKTVSFDHRGYWYTESFMVGYSTTTNDTADFTWVETVQSPAVDNPWNHYQNLTIPGDAKYIAIHHSDGIALFLDNFMVDATSPCTAPANLTTSNVTSTSADLSWYQTSDNLDITLYYVTADDSIANIVENVSLTDGVYTLYSLTENTAYSWMLSVICDGDTLFTDIADFTTPCGQIETLPFFQDFNDAAITGLPECWFQLQPYNGYPKVTDSHAHSGNALEFRGNYLTNTPSFAILPQFTTDLSELQISFWSRRGSSSSGTLAVGYMTDPSNPGSFVTLSSYSALQIDDNEYHFYTVLFSDVNTVPDMPYHIAFQYETTSSWSWYVDDITVELIPDCSAPQALVVTDVTPNSAILSWTGNTERYTLYYKTDDDTTWIAVSDITLDTNGYALEDLNASTTYQWYVAAVCDDSTQTASATISSFTTSCYTQISPYSMDFDAGVSLPECWKRYAGSANNAFAGTAPISTSAGWAFTNTNVFGQNHATLNIYGTSRYFWLVSPSIDLNNLSVPNLSFYLALTDNNNASPIENLNGQADDKFMVIISTDDGASWSAANATVWSNDGSGDHSFNQISSIGEVINIPLTEYAGETIRVAFYGESSVSNGSNDLHIDNVTLDEIPSCETPSQVTVTNVTDTTADISWTENGDSDTWLVEYFPENDIYGTPTGSVIVTGTPSVTLQNLQPNAYHQLTMRAICNDGSYSSAAFGGFRTTLPPVPLPYTTNFSTGTEHEWQLNDRFCTNWWAFGTVNNTGAMFVTNNSIDPTPAYGVTSSAIISAVKTLIVGTASDIKISFDVMIGGESHFDFLKLFLAPDSLEYPAATTTFNVNYASASYTSHAFSFADYLSFSSVQNYPYKFNLTGGNTVHIDAIMPNPYHVNATAFSVAKLVFLWRNDSNGGTQPGAVTSNLSVTPVTCQRPINLAVNNITSVSADIAWTPAGTENVWNLEYKMTTDSAWTVLPVTTTTFTLTGLMPDTAYQVRVQADCGSGDVSTYAFQTFTTLSDETPDPCDVPTGLHVVTLSSGEQTNNVVWDNDEDVMHWELQYAKEGEDWTTETVNDHFYQLIDIVYNTNYAIRVRAVCSNGEVSDWTEPVTMMVPCGIEDHLYSRIALYPNPANDYVNVQCTMNNVQLEGIEVLDVYGKVVRTVVGTNNYSLLQTCINVSGLANGMYFVRVTTDEGTVTKTFMKR